MSEPVPRWRMILAGAIVGLLAGALVVQTNRTATTATPTTAASTSSTDPTLAATTTTVSVPVTTTSLAADETTTTLAADAVDRSADVRRALQESLDAWGRFGASGDLTDVSGFFWEDSPQWERFELEAAQPAPGGEPFNVTYDEKSLVHDETEASIQVTVTFQRGAEAGAQADWVIVMRADDNRWLIWSVAQAQS